MNQLELLEYMTRNKGLAQVGKQDTMFSAKELEARGMIVRVGEWLGNPIYKLTDKGTQHLQSLSGRKDTLKRIFKPTGYIPERLGTSVQTE